MWVNLVGVLWIAYDVGISIRTAHMPVSGFTDREWYAWLISGIALAAAAFLAAFLDRRADRKQIEGLNKQLTKQEGIQLGGFSAMGLQIQMLAKAMGLSPEKPDAVITAAIARIEAEVERSKPRFLTQQQRETLVSFLRERLGPRTPGDFRVVLRVREDDAEAGAYGHQILTALEPIQLIGSYYTPVGIPVDLCGLVIQVADTNHIPKGARLLSDAFEKAGIKSRFDSASFGLPAPLGVDGFALIIGTKG